MLKKEQVKVYQSEVWQEEDEFKGQVVEINKTKSTFKIIWISSFLPTEEIAHRACELWAQKQGLVLSRATDKD